MKRLCTLTLAASLFACQLAHAEAPAQEADSPRQVILIIGDGMDEHQITIARNYLKGARGQLVMDGLPVRAAAQILASVSICHTWSFAV